MKRSLAILMILTMMLAACAPAATVVAPTSAPAKAAEPTAVPPTDAPEPTVVPPTDAPAPTEVPPTATSAPTATEAASTEEAPAATSAPAATAVPPTATTAPKATSAPGDPAQGKTIWAAQTCVGCHGPNAEGGIGPKLAGTGLSYDQVLLQVRLGKAPMPAFTAEQVSDQQVAHILAWLKSLAAAPAPAPAAKQPTYPTGALVAMWQSINDMKVKSDFAKDLPERQAQDDAGRLAILKQHAGEAAGLAQAAVAQGNQAISEIPDEAVRAVLRSAIDQANRVGDLANQAQGKGSFGEAYPLAAEMVKISRLDAWPLATQAVRDAGLTGNVRVQVVNQAGRPIPNAYVTVLTAHTPVGVRTDAAGMATINGVAAVPALQVKAYNDGLVYHEVHVNLAQGATAEARIALPGPSVGGQTPGSGECSDRTGSGRGRWDGHAARHGDRPAGGFEPGGRSDFCAEPGAGASIRTARHRRQPVSNADETAQPGHGDANMVLLRGGSSMQH